MSTSESSRIRIVVADDHLVVRTGLRMLLDAQEDFEVVAEAGDVEAAVRALRGYRPDVLVLDLTMPGESSIAAMPRIAAEFPHVAILVLTMQGQPSFAREALRRGARGYVLKEGAEGDLVEAVRVVANGSTYLTATLGARLAVESARGAQAPDRLTAREVEILRLIVLGHTNTDIAERMFVSVRTVESHRARIHQKLGRATRAELVRYALDQGLVTPDTE